MARSSLESTSFMSEQAVASSRNGNKDPRTTPPLPTEIWLQILEHDNPKHLWLHVRNVSHAFRDRVERLFTSEYLHRLKVALSLPRRDPATSKLKWRGDPIPGLQLVMAYNRLSKGGNKVLLESPTLLKDRNSEKTLEELRETGTLPKERLEEAPTNVNMSSHPMASLTIKLPVQVDWDGERKIWVWEVEWRGLLSRFFVAKDKQSRRWPSGTDA